MNATWRKNEGGGSIPRPGTNPLKAFARLALIAACGVVFSTSAGCSWWRSLTGQDTSPGTATPTSRPAATQSTFSDVAPVPPALAPENRPVVQGPLPLIYLVEANGTLRVRNVRSGEEIITFAAKASQIVRVDAGGVFLANAPVVGANLLPGEYAIEMVPPTDGIRTTQQRNVTEKQ